MTIRRAHNQPRSKALGYLNDGGEPSDRIATEIRRTDRPWSELRRVFRDGIVTRSAPDE